MQHAPLAQLPEQRHHRDWGMIIALVIVIAIAILTGVVLLEPGTIFAPAVSNVAINPELAAFERYQAASSAAPRISVFDNPELSAFERLLARTSAAPSFTGPDNPELSSFHRYVELQPGDLMLRGNPEVRQFQQWLEGQ